MHWGHIFRGKPTGIQRLPFYSTEEMAGSNKWISCYHLKRSTKYSILRMPSKRSSCPKAEVVQPIRQGCTSHHKVSLVC